jgi:hypothetical protein
VLLHGGGANRREIRHAHSPPYTHYVSPPSICHRPLLPSPSLALAVSSPCDVRVTAFVRTFPPSPLPPSLQTTVASAVDSITTQTAAVDATFGPPMVPRPGRLMHTAEATSPALRVSSTSAPTSPVRMRCTRKARRVSRRRAPTRTGWLRIALQGRSPLAAGCAGGASVAPSPLSPPPSRSPPLPATSHWQPCHLLRPPRLPLLAIAPPGHRATSSVAVDLHPAAAKRRPLPSALPPPSPGASLFKSFQGWSGLH